MVLEGSLHPTKGEGQTLSKATNPLMYNGDLLVLVHWGSCGTKPVVGIINQYLIGLNAHYYEINAHYMRFNPFLTLLRWPKTESR